MTENIDKPNITIPPIMSTRAMMESTRPAVAEPLRVRDLRPWIPVITPTMAQIKDISVPTNGIIQMRIAMMPMVSAVVA
jgi:hypothetical protein